MFDPTETLRLSFSARLRQLATARPSGEALVFISADGRERAFSWEELDSVSNRFARLLESRGIGSHSRVAILLQNGPEHVLSALAIWKLGACAIPLNPQSPRAERARLMQLISPTVVIADAEVSEWVPGRAVWTSEHNDAPLPDCIPHPGKAICSGGSTGEPKLIVDMSPWSRVPGEMRRYNQQACGLDIGERQLVSGPLHHNAPFTWTHFGLFEGQTVVLTERFDPQRFLDVVEARRINFAFVVPTMLTRLLRLPQVRKADTSSVTALRHGAAACPSWLKRQVLTVFGAERVFEGYGTTELPGITTIRGDEWLRRPGSVGRSSRYEIRVADEAGPVAAGVVGDILVRPRGSNGELPFRYIGAGPPRITSDGFCGFGDMGWVDSDGYLYIADRRTDLIVTGGMKVYPAEVEGVLSSHPSVADVVVIGLEDDEWGKRVHAIVEPLGTPGPGFSQELLLHCRRELAPHKVPKSIEFVARLQRDDAGKVRRASLTERVR